MCSLVCAVLTCTITHHMRPRLHPTSHPHSPQIRYGSKAPARCKRSAVVGASILYQTTTCRYHNKGLSSVSGRTPLPPAGQGSSPQDTMEYTGTNKLHVTAGVSGSHLVTTPPPAARALVRPSLSIMLSVWPLSWTRVGTGGEWRHQGPFNKLVAPSSGTCFPRLARTNDRSAPGPSTSECVWLSAPWAPTSVSRISASQASG